MKIGIRIGENVKYLYTYIDILYTIYLNRFKFINKNIINDVV